MVPRHAVMRHGRRESLQSRPGARALRSLAIQWLIWCERAATGRHHQSTMRGCWNVWLVTDLVTCCSCAVLALGRRCSGRLTELDTDSLVPGGICELSVRCGVPSGSFRNWCTPHITCLVAGYYGAFFLPGRSLGGGTVKPSADWCVRGVKMALPQGAG